MRRLSTSRAMFGDQSVALAVIFIMGMTLAGIVWIGVVRLMPAGRAQLELKVEEGLGSFDRLPIRWALVRHQ